MATKTTSQLYELTNASGFTRQRAWLLSDSKCTGLQTWRFGRGREEEEMKAAQSEALG
jgi:hypothetical protein